MRELTADEVGMVSAGPSAIAPLALANQHSCSVATPAVAIHGLHSVATRAILSNDPDAIAKYVW